MISTGAPSFVLRSELLPSGFLCGCLVHAAHTATAAGHTAASALLVVFLDVGHQGFGGEHQAGDRSGVLECEASAFARGARGGWTGSMESQQHGRISRAKRMPWLFELREGRRHPERQIPRPAPFKGFHAAPRRLAAESQVVPPSKQSSFCIFNGKLLYLGSKLEPMPAATKRKLAIASLEKTSADLSAFLPRDLAISEDPQTLIPRLAKDEESVRAIEQSVRCIPTAHRLYHGDARYMLHLAPESVHLVLTSPPYWTLKEYRECDAQLGHVEDYDQFLEELDKVWKQCFEALVPGGRLICVVGDVCLSRRENGGRHTVVPLHASIQERCRRLGFDNLAPIIWHKISNAAYEVENGSGGFLGKPYEPNGVIKNDIEFILMQRKPGGYRAPDLPTKVLSLISADNHKKWFQQIWAGVTGASTKEHPAPYPTELAERLIRMFSFVGDTVLDPFLGTGTTTVAAAKWGRNSIGVEVDNHYLKLAERRINQDTSSLFGTTEISVTELQ
jgi:modification methylase